MKKNLLLGFTVFCCVINTSAQNFKGQWKGEFIDKSTSFQNFGGDKCEYVLELETAGNKVTGHSYTYFSEGGKRFYTICKLEGFINRKEKFIEVKETERTKTNVPVHIRNCFQVHRLNYTKISDSEILEGNWVPAPKQQGDCGFGYTNLTRRVLVTNMPGMRNSTARVIPKKTNPVVTTPKPKTKSPEAAPKTITRGNEQAVVREIPQEKLKETDIKKTLPSIIPNYKTRNTNLLKTIEVSRSSVRVDLYDNGEIDGDSISLYYNGKMLVNKQRLSDRAITFTLDIDNPGEVNELVMYAENLGSIPPNTALMVVTDGNNRYEVRITSDLQKSGVINFVKKTD